MIDDQWSVHHTGAPQIRQVHAFLPRLRPAVAAKVDGITYRFDPGRESIEIILERALPDPESIWLLEPRAPIQLTITLVSHGKDLRSTYRLTGRLVGGWITRALEQAPHASLMASALHRPVSQAVQQHFLIFKN